MRDSASRVIRRAGISGISLALVLTLVPHAWGGPTETYRDEFTTKTYSGNDGTAPFSTPWREVGEDGDPGDGDIYVNDDAHCATGPCLVIGKAQNGDPAIYRQTDLKNAAWAQLSFTYKRHQHGSGGGHVALWVSPNGGSNWVQLTTYPLSTSDSGQTAASFDISPYTGSSTRIRFQLVGSTGDDSHLNVDNFQVAYGVNAPPVLDPIGDQSGVEGSPVVFTAIASDPDPGDVLSFSLAGAPAGAAIDPASGVFSWTPTESQGPGTHTFDVVVSDDAASPGSDSETITITVAEVNDPPVLAPIGLKTVAEGSTLTFTAVAADPDAGDSVTYSLSDAPLGAVIAPTSGVFGWTPTEAQGPRSYTFEVIATDQGAPALSDRETVTVTVTEVNEPPVLEPIADRSIDEGSLLSFTASASDPDPGNALGFSLSGAPSGAAIGPASGIFTWTPAEAHGPGVHTFDVVVTDDGTPALSDSRTVTVTVAEVNNKPVIEPIGDRSVDETDTLAFTVVAYDSDAIEDVSYSLRRAPPGAVIGSSSGRFSWTPTEAQGPGAYTFDVVAREGGASPRTNRETITVTVHEVNQPPVIEIPGTQSGDEGEPVTIRVTVNDPDLPANSLRFSATGLPPGLTIAPATGVVSGTIEHTAAANSPYSVTVSVTDGSAVRDTTFTWLVRQVNEPPTGADAAFITDEDTALAISVAAVDLDDDELTFTIVTGPGIGRLTGRGPEFTYVPDDGAFGTDEFTYWVHDGTDASPLYTVTITVREVNVAPHAGRDVFATGFGEDLVVAAPGVLANDDDGDGDPLLIEIAEPPGHGTLVLNPDGSFRFQPDARYFGTDSFTYRISDPSGASAVGAVTIDVGEPPDVVPVASATRDLVVNQVLRSDDPPPKPGAEDESLPSFQRSVVTMGRAARAGVTEMGFPMVLLAVAVGLVVTLGRISVAPAFRRGARHAGTVRMYDTEAGFGLATRDGDGKDVFIHESAVPRRHRRHIGPGDRVAMRCLAGDHRAFASRVTPLK